MTPYDWKTLAAEFGDEIDAVLAAAPAPVEPR
jgi:hypothetical protein